MITRAFVILPMACIGMMVVTSSCNHLSSAKQEPLRVGIIADCQYCSAQGQGVRKYSLSKDKLAHCVEHFNTLDLDYVIHLGDFIERDFENFDVLNPIYNQLEAPNYHVLGNHDFSVDAALKKDVPQKMGLPARYYDFKVKGWRFVVLDGNDISFHAYPKGSAAYAEAAEYYDPNKIKSAKWNGAVGAEQLSWLQQVLEAASGNTENVLLYCHFPVYPENNHNLWNAEEVVELLESYPCVKAYINGHNHKGGYASKQGIHYLTLKGMVDTEQTSYAVIHVDGDHLTVTGYGREEHRLLKLKKTGL